MNPTAGLRFRIDNGLSPIFAASLRQAGHEVVHVRDLGMATAEDEHILELAARENRIVVSLDTDFGTLLAHRKRSKPSVILFRRRSGRRPEEQARLLLANLQQITDALLTGSVVVIEQNRIRVRSLPMNGTGAA